MVTVGADPEFFIVERDSQDVVSAAGRLGGTKKRPVPIPHLGEGFGLQEDNVMGEFNVPPAGSSREFRVNIERAIMSIREFVLFGDRLDIGTGRYMWELPEAVLHTPAARHLGCSPDFDAYGGGRAFPVVSTETLGPRRFAGGHVHIGYDNPNNIPPWVVARLCDIYITLPMLVEDQQPERRTLYGQAGRFRPTRYGIEYRAPCNKWIFSSFMIGAVGARAITVGSLVQMGEAEVARAFGRVPWDDVQRIINSEDSEQADALYGYLVDEGAVLQ